MTPPLFPERWRESPSEAQPEAPVERQLAWLWQRAELNPELSGKSWERLDGGVAKAMRPPRFKAVRTGLTFLGVGLSIGLAFAARFSPTRHTQYKTSTASLAPVSALPPTLETRLPTKPELSEGGAVATVLPATHRRSKRAASSPPAIPSLASPAVPSPVPKPVLAPTPLTQGTLENEADELAQALQLLYRQRDPAGARAELVIYRHRFPHGTLFGEAILAEINADLSLGLKESALELLNRLDGQAYAGIARADEMRLLRSELLATEGRCSEAMPELSAVLRAAASDDFQERALFARATCRAANGDPVGSRGDFQLYLRRFPRGASAAKARRALSGP